MTDYLSNPAVQQMWDDMEMDGPYADEQEKNLAVDSFIFATGLPEDAEDEIRAKIDAAGG